MIQVTYQKRSGEVIQKLINVYTSYRVGETNGYGWKIIDMKYWYKNKFLSYHEYNTMTDKTWKRSLKFINFKRKSYKLYRELGYSIILVILFKCLEMLFYR